MSGSSLKERILLSCIKESIIQPIIKNPQLATDNLNNFHPIANIPFLGKVIERVLANQFQTYLEEQEYPDPASAEMALVMLDAVPSQHRP